MSSLLPDQLALQLQDLEGWQLDGQELSREYVFDDYAKAVGFLVQAAFFAKELEHYPHLLVYHTRISVRIGDKEQGTVHSRDVQLARRLQSVAAGLVSP